MNILVNENVFVYIKTMSENNISENRRYIFRYPCIPSPLLFDFRTSSILITSYLFNFRSSSAEKCHVKSVIFYFLQFNLI